MISCRHGSWESRLSKTDIYILVEGEDCPICMETLDTNVIVTHCAHKFHSNCLMEWNRQNTTCPLCRTELGSTGEEVKREEQKGENIPRLENPLNYLYRNIDDAILFELRAAVKRRINEWRLQTPPNSRFHCPCGSNISRSSGNQHFHSNRHIIWLNTLSENTMRDLLF